MGPTLDQTRNIGSGTPNLSWSVSGYATVSDPGFGFLAGSTADAIGATPPSATFTIATGITVVVPVVVERISMSESRIRPGVPVSISGKNAGELVVTWTGS